MEGGGREGKNEFGRGRKEREGMKRGGEEGRNEVGRERQERE